MKNQDMKPDTYHVWRRNDGYIAATCNYMPAGFTSANGAIVTFDALGSFNAWIDAYECIEANRSVPA